MVISSIALVYEIRAVEFSQNINNRAIYCLRFLIKFKILKVAHTPIYITALCPQVARGGEACSTQLP